MANLHYTFASAPSLPRREAELLLAHVTGNSREWIIAHPEAELAAEQRHQFESLAARAAAGTPLPYLLGHWEFFGLDFRITPHVLIPRPETELLVETALNLARNSNFKIQNSKLLDVGTGSGIIAVTLAIKLPAAQIIATDNSAAALAVAKTNAEAHGVADRITFIQSDLLSAFRISHSAFDLVCANLPYIATAELEALAVARHEPGAALDGGPDGLRLIEPLLAAAPARLNPGGALLAEIAAGQGPAAFALARRYFPEAKCEVRADLAKKDRLLVIQMLNSQFSMHNCPL